MCVCLLAYLYCAFQQPWLLREHLGGKLQDRTVRGRGGDCSSGNRGGVVDVGVWVVVAVTVTVEALRWRGREECGGVGVCGFRGLRQRGKFQGLGEEDQGVHGCLSLCCV